MASYTIRSAASSSIYAKLVLTEQSQSVANNTTTLSWQLYMWNTQAKPNWYAYEEHNIVQISINGQYVLNTDDFGMISLQYEQTESSAKLISSGTTTIAHDSDGSKTISASFYVEQGWYGAYKWSGSNSSMTLTTIARASEPSLSASSVKLGSGVTIYTNRASSGFTHTLKYSIGSASGTIATGVGASYAWTPSKNLANQFPNTSSGVVTITCETYNGSTLIGTESTALTVNISDDMYPSISSISFSEAASLPSGISGYIQSKSKLKVTVSASGIYGSSISSYQIKVNGETHNSSSATTGYLNTVGTNTITVTVTDSRGRPTTDSSKTFTVVAYSPPRIDSLSAYRCNSSGTADDEGAYMKIVFTGTIASISGNTRSVTLTTSPSTSPSISYSGTTYSFTGTSSVVAASTTSSYDISVTVGDKFSTSSAYTTSISTASILMNILSDKSGMAIGKMAEKAKTLQLGWDLEVFDQPANTVLAAPNGSDGVAQFRKLLDTDIDCQLYSSTIDSNGTGWYRIFDANVGNVSGFAVFDFKLGRTYNSPQNENYHFSVAVSYSGQIDITQLSGVIGGHLITKIRVVYKNSGDIFIDFYTNAGASTYQNIYYVYGGHGYGTFCAPTAATIPDGYSTYEFDTVMGCKSSRGFTGSLTGTATAVRPESGMYYGTGNRITSANIAPKNDSSLYTFLATSSMTEGKPNGEGNILHMEWDNGGWSTQLFIPHSSNKPMQYRHMADGTWMNYWISLLDSDSVADYPVAQATSGHGIWSFIKLNNGIAMCWGKTAICDTAFTSTWSSWYVHDYLFPAQRFPFDFVAIPHVFASQGNPGTTACDWAIYSDGGATTQYTPKYSVFRPATVSATVNLSLNLFAIGRWK